MTYNYTDGRQSAYYDAFQYSYPEQLNISQRLKNVPVSFSTPATGMLSDKEYVVRWEETIKNRVEPNIRKRRAISISEARKNMQRLVFLVDDLKNQEKHATETVNSASDDQWNITLNIINSKRVDIDRIMSDVNDTHLKELQHSLSKRNAKRARMKKVKSSKAEEKKQMLKYREETGRKIDEHLQKMKDELEKIKRAEEQKLEADIFLRDVLRRKHDARKCVAKLRALVKLRHARLQTARGRGESASEAEALDFNRSIEKLISMWNDKLASYEREESELRLKLNKSSEDDHKWNRVGDDTTHIVAAWKEAMFGSPNVMPQRDFHGDFGEFISVRTKWDAYIEEEGSAIPVGWLLPQQERTITE